MKLSRRIIPLFVALVTTAVAQSPVVRAHLEPASGILVGQPVRLVVSVYVPNYFTGTPEFPEFEIENAIVVLPQDRPENSNTQIGGSTYAGITETYVIYPQQAGDFHVPTAQLTVPYAIAPPKSARTKVPLPLLSFHASLPAAAEGLDYFLPTASLTMQERWSRPLEHLRVGDSVERAISVTATRMQAMLIPPLALIAPKGIRLYPEEPVVQEHKTDRGDFVYGRRTETAKYFLEKVGDYTVPPIELKWWNLTTHRMVTTNLPPVHFNVAPNPNYVAELPPEAESSTIAATKPASKWKTYRRIALIAVPSFIAAVLLMWISWRFLPRFFHEMAVHRERRRHTEDAIFRQLLRSCNRNRAEYSYTLLIQWIKLSHPGWTVDQVLRHEDNPALSAEIDGLGAAMFAKDEKDKWRGSRMASLLRQSRKTARNHPSRHDYRLPDLNPR